MEKYTILGQEFTHQELKDRFSIPDNIRIEGCSVISTDEKQREYMNKLNNVMVFEVFGFGEELSKLLLENEIIYSDPLEIFNPNLSVEMLMNAGFGKVQAENYLKGIKDTYSKGIPFNLLIKTLNINGCGNTIAEQFTRKYYGMDHSTVGLTKAIWSELEESNGKFEDMISKIQNFGYSVINPYKDEKPISADSIKVVLTGSPKGFGFKTKAEFLKKFPNLVEVKKMADADCLVTDSLTSSSSKMKDAAKFNKTIKTYEDQF